MKKMIFLTVDIPDRLNSGYKIRTYHILKKLSKKYEIHILHVGDIEKDFNTFNNSYTFLHARKKNIFNIFKSFFMQKPFLVFRYTPKNLNEAVTQIIKKYKIDTVYMNLTEYELSLEDERLCYMIDQHDYISETMKNAYIAEKNILKKFIYYIEFKKFLVFERKYYSEYDCENNMIFSVKKEDERKTSQIVKKAKTITLENGFDLARIENKIQNYKYNILFVGTSHPRNIDALKEFYFHVLPKIDKMILDNTYINIVGASNLKDLMFIDLKKYNISIHSFVENMDDFYSYGSIVVLPYKMGGGSKLKVLEAFAHGVPVLGYDLTFSGIDETPSYFMCQDSNEIAEKIKVFSDENIYKEYSQKCLNIAPKYDWNAILTKLDGIL